MSQDETKAPTETQASLEHEFAGADSTQISYDYFKSMVSLSVLALGGIVGLSESLFADRITIGQMLVVGGFMAASGIVALQCQSDIVQISRGRKAPTLWLRWGHRIVPAFFGAGIGGFVVLLSGVLG